MDNPHNLEDRPHRIEKYLSQFRVNGKLKASCLIEITKELIKVKKQRDKLNVTIHSNRTMKVREMVLGEEVREMVLGEEVGYRREILDVALEEMHKDRYVID